MVRYYGHYSNASRGLRQEKNLDDLIPSTLELEDLKPNRTRARLIQKIYEVDPLTCPKCQGGMKTISFIEDEGLPRGFLQEYKTESGGFGDCDFCYLSSGFRQVKMFRYDFQLFNWSS